MMGINKKIKSLRAISLVYSLIFLVIISTITIFTILPSRANNNQNNNTLVVHDAAYYDAIFDTKVNSAYLQYEVNDSSSRTVTLVGLTGGNSYGDFYRALDIPEYVSPSNVTGGTPGVDYKVTRIDLTSGYTRIGTDSINLIGTSTPNINDGRGYIRAVRIPKSVEYIESYSFYGFSYLEYFESPFIGTERNSSALYMDDALENGGVSQKISKPFVSMFSMLDDMPFYSPGSTPFESVYADWYDDPDFAQTYINDGHWGYSIPSLLTKVVISDDEHIGNHALFDLKNVTTLEIGKRDGVAMIIGQYAFAESGYVNVTLPSSDVQLSLGVFSKCANLSSIVIPDGITEIPDSAFNECVKMTKVVLPSDIKNIDSLAFKDCSSLNEIVVYDENPLTPFPHTQGYTLDLPNGLLKISNNAFYGCHAFDRIILPDSLEEIGSSSFGDCVSLTEITVPFVGKKANTVYTVVNEVNKVSTESLFGYIFGTSSSSEYSYKVEQTSPDNSEQDHKDFYLPKSLKTVTVTQDSRIESHAFMNCRFIENVTIEPVTQYIGANTFYGCSALTQIRVPFMGTTETSAQHFGIIFSNTQFTGATSESNGYYVPSSLSNVTITKQRTIYNKQLYNLAYINSITISDETNYIEESVLHGNAALTNLTLPFVGCERGVFYRHYWWWRDLAWRNTLQWIFSGTEFSGSYANDSLRYYDGYRKWIPSNLTYVNITSDTTISTYGFRNFSTLTEINVTATYIDEGCMTGCSGLTKLELPFIGHDINTDLKKSREYVLGWIFGTGEYYNSYAASAYSTWYIPKGLTSVHITNKNATISNYAFANLTSLSQVHFPLDAAIASVGDYAFYNCSKLSAIEYPSAVFTKVGNYSFYGVSAINDIDRMIPATAVELGNYSFANTSVGNPMYPLDLTKYTKIGNYAFANCQLIEAIDITANLDSSRLGEGVFQDCQSLTDVTLTSKTVTKNLFKNCISLEKIDCRGITVIPDGLFSGCYKLKYDSTPTDSLIEGFVQDPLTSSIGEYAFYNCRSFDNFVIYATTTTINSYAFSGCTGLEYLTMPKEVVTIHPYAWKDCNPNFYFYVYEPQDKWPQGWVENWNCYYPVYIINDTSSNLFTYKYDNDHKGYFITGTVEGVQLSGQVIFPSYHDGLKVLGVTNTGTRLDNGSYVNKISEQAGITSVVLPSSMYSIADGAFNNGHRVDVYVESTEARVNGFLTDPNIPAESPYEPEITKGWVIGEEDLNWISEGYIFYGDYWEYVNVTSNSKVPYLKASSLEFLLDFDNQTYNGYEITPNAVLAILLPAQVKISDSSTNSTHVYNAPVQYEQYSGYNGRASIDVYMWPTGYTPVTANYTDMFSYTYTDNINAGSASMTASLISTKYNAFLSELSSAGLNPIYIKGNKVQKYEIKKSAISIYATSYNSGTGLPERYKEYDRKEWSNDEWGGIVYGLPTGAIFTGKLSTRSEKAGIYTFNSCPNDDSNYVQFQKGDFEWTRDWKIMRNGSNLAENYELYLYLEVTIRPQKVVIEWTGGEWENEQQITYLYGYKGQEKVQPQAAAYYYDSVHNELTDDIVTYCDVVAVNRSSNVGYYPSSSVYSAAAYLKDTTNFLLVDKTGTPINNPVIISDVARNCVETQWKIVKGKVIISVNVETYLANSDTYWKYLFDEVKKNGINRNGNSLPAGISISGLGEGSLFTALLRTNSDDAATYDYSNTPISYGSSAIQGSEQARKTYFEATKAPTNDGEITDTFHIYRKTLNEQTQEYEYFDELAADYYDVIIDLANVRIIYYDFDVEYYVSKVDDTNETKVNSYSQWQQNGQELRLLTSVTYNVDGQTYKLYVKTTNTDPVPQATITYFYDQIGGSNPLIFHDVKDYNVEVHISAKHFNSYDSNVTLHAIKSNIILKDPLEKEYDRKPIDVINDGLITKIGADQATDILDSDGNPTLVIRYYAFEDTSHSNPLNYVPSGVGRYIMYIWAKEGEFFNGINGIYRNVQITKRKIYIDLSGQTTEFAENITGSKPFDGTVQTFTPSSAYLLSQGYLLDEELDALGNVIYPKDEFSGVLSTGSANAGTYRGDVTPMNVDWTTPWGVYNQNGNATGNYQIVFVNSFVIEKLNFDYDPATFEHEIDCYFDNQIHYPYVEATTSRPEDAGLMKIYYSNAPVNPFVGDVINTNYSVTTLKYAYSSPISTKVYYYVVCPNYNSLIGELDVEIRKKIIVYNDPSKEIITDEDTSMQYIVKYDSNPHQFVVTVDEPVYATVYYSLDKVNWTTIPYSVTECNDDNTLKIYYKIEALNYETVYSTENNAIAPIEFIVSERDLADFPSNMFGASDNTVSYNGEEHGIIISKPNNYLGVYHIYYSIDYDGVDANANWSETEYKYTAAGQYDIYVKFVVLGYKTKIVKATLKIENLSFEGISLVNYSDKFDNEYHTVGIAGLTKTEIKNEKDEITAINWSYNHPTLGEIPVTVGYTSNSDATQAGYGFKDKVEYKNVGTYKIYVMISAPNFNDLILGQGANEGVVEILFNDSPSFEYTFKEIQYTSKKLDLKDLEIVTCHDGIPSIQCWVAQENLVTSVLSCDYTQGSSDAIELGPYCFKITYPATSNCAKLVFGGESGVTLDLASTDQQKPFFRIVPKVLEVKWPEYYLVVENEEKKYVIPYDGEEHLPSLYVETGTNESIDLYTSPSQIMKEIGSYTFNIAPTTTNPNYVLDKYQITIEIRKINLDINIDVEKYKDGQIYDSEGPWEYLNLPLLSGHRFVARVYSNRFITGEYYYTGNSSTVSYNMALIEWDIIKVTTSIVDGKIQYTPVLDANEDTISVKDYYNVNSINIKISIVDPPMDGLIKKIKVPEYDYDGNPHSLVLDFSDAPALSGATIRYKGENEENFSSTFVPRTDVGEYKYTVQIVKPGYKTGYLETALKIKAVNVAVNILPLDDPDDPTDDGYDVYDGIGKNTTYTVTNISSSVIDNFSTLPNYQSDQGHLRYYSADTITKTQLENFYKSFTIGSSIYQNALTTITDAGTYYCVVYYYGTTTKWKETTIIKELVVKPKDIDVYFSTPVTNSKEYDGTPLTLPLSSVTFDLSDLITGHSIPTNIQNLFFAKTNSANANNEISPGVFGYYDCATGYDWGYMVIYDENQRNIYKNYHPVINGDVELSITKAYLSTSEFYIVNNPTTKVYDGADAIPDFQAPELSTFEYTYYKYDDSGNIINNANGTPKEYSEAKNVGRYLVKVSLISSVNYYSSNQSNVWVQGDVIINPKPVTVVWSDTEQQFTGELLKPTATITDAFDNEIPLEVYFVEKYDVQESTTGGYILMPGALKGHYGPNNKYESIEYLWADENDYVTYPTLESYYQGELSNYDRYDITVVESLGQIKAGIYQAYARPSSTFTSLSSNYTISNFTTNFQINKKTYKIVIGTEENNHTIKTYTDGATKWSTIITADDILDFPEELAIRGKSSPNNAYLSTSGYQVGQYTLPEDFDYSEIKVVEPTTNTDVTDSIEVEVLGTVIIESKTIAVDASDVTKIYSSTGYNLLSLDVIKLLNISASRCLFTFYVNDSDTPIYNDVTSDILLNVGVYTIKYEIADSHEGTDKYNTAMGYITVTIIKAPAFINFKNNNLSKEYDGAPIDVEGAISNKGFNGSLQDLEYTYYEYVTQTVNGVTTTNKVLIGVGDGNAPVDAGSYSVTIRSTVDTLSPLDNNFEELFVSKDYNITPKDYILTFNESRDVTQTDLNQQFVTVYKDANGYVVKLDSNGTPCYYDAANNTYKYSNGTTATGTLVDSNFIFDEVGVITGANGDIMKYKISSVATNGLAKTRYRYQNTYSYEAPTALSTDTYQNRTFTALGADNINYGFTLSWLVTSKYRVDSNGNALDMSRNYRVVFDFDLYLHYQLMEGINVQGITAEYDGNSKSGTFTAPTNVTNYTQFYSTNKTDVDSGTGCTNDIQAAMVSRTTPGTTTVYYKITSPNYEPVVGSFIVKVNKVERQDILIEGVSIDTSTDQYALGVVKIYDGYPAFTSPTGSNYFIPSYTYSLYQSSMADNIPASSVGISYVKYGDNIAIDPSVGCINSGIYTFVLTLPETEFYKAVSLEGTFTIDYREIAMYTPLILDSNNKDVSVVYSKDYRGSEWQINIDTANNNLEANSFYVFQIIQDDGSTADLPNNLSVSGIITTSDKVAGLYTGNGTPSLNWYNSDVLTNPKVLVDGVDQSNNYTVLLHKSGVGTAKFKINPIAMNFTLQNATVRYNGNPQLFNVVMNVPSNASISYWNDTPGNEGWTTDTTKIEKTKVGTYNIKIKIEADNYETVETTITFEILKSQGNAVIDSILSKEYNGQETLLPESLTFSSQTYKTEAGDSHRFIYKFYELVNNSYIDFSEIKYDPITNSPIITSNYPGISRPINAGSYKVIVQIPETENYEAFEAVQEFVITQKELEISWGQETSFVYDGTSKQIAVTCQAMGSDVIYLNYTFSGQTSNCDLAHSFVGTYKQIASIAIGTGVNETDPDVAKNYKLPTDSTQYSKSFTITARDLKVILTKPSLNIGEFTNEFTYVPDTSVQPLPQGYYLDGLAASDSVTGKLHIVDPTTAGTHNGINTQTGFYWSGNAYSNYNPANPDSLKTRIAISRISDGSPVEINYNVKYTDLKVELGYSSITPTVVGVDVIYDGQEHKPSVSVDYGTGYVIYYSLNSELHNVLVSGDPTTYGSTTLPEYQNKGNRSYIDANDVDSSGNASPVTIYFQIRNSNNSTQIYNGNVNVLIKRRNANLNWVELNPSLSKTYDGLRVDNPPVASDDPAASYVYTYYDLTDTSFSNPYPSNPYNAGKYNLKVTMQNSSNYIYTPLQMSFEIAKRNITISVTDTKTYNLAPWTKVITNDNVVNIAAGDTIGAASGETNCILQTASVNVGDYNNYAQYPNGGYGDIRWSSLNGFDIKRVVDTVSVSVKDNYNITYNLSVSITLSKMKAKITGYTGEWDGVAHYVKVELEDYVFTDENSNVISYPKPNASTVSVYYKIDEDTDWGAANQPKGRTNAGTSLVYIKIEAPNYEPLLITPGAPIPWDPNNVYDSYINIEGLNGNASISYNSEFTYTGDEYPTPICAVSNYPAGTPYSITYYDQNPNNVVGLQGTTDAPIHVGTYWFKYHIDQAGAVDAFDKIYQFEIVPAEVEVIWDNLVHTYEREVVDNGIDPIHYSAIVKVPTAKFELTSFDKAKSDYNIDNSGYVPLDIYLKTINNDQSYSYSPFTGSSEAGTYNLVALINDQNPNSYIYKDYTLIVITSESKMVIKKYEITNPVISDTLTTQFGDKVLIRTSAGDIFEIDSDGKVLKYTDSEGNDKTDQNGNPLVDPNLPYPYKFIVEDGDVGTHTIKVVLTDPNNTIWDNPNTSDDIEKTYTITKRVFDPNNPTSKIVIGNYTYTHLVTGEPICPAIASVTDVSLADNSVLRTLVKGKDYTIAYDNNTGLSSPGNLAKIIITGMGNYEFEIIKEFEIVNPKPKLLELKEDASIRFMTATFTREDGAIFQEDPIATPKRDDSTYLIKDYYIGHLVPNTLVTAFVANFKNDIDKIKIYNFDGELIFDNGLPVGDTEGVVTTGSIVELYDDAGNLSDKITCILYGDIDGDGQITAFDKATLMTVVKGTADVVLPGETLSVETEVTIEQYLSCYTSRDSNFITAFNKGELVSVLKGTYDLNEKMATA